MHPLFVRSDARIEGLVLVTMLAVLVRALLERVGRQGGVALSADKLIAAFAPLQAIDLRWIDGSWQQRLAEATPFQRQVLQTFGWPAPEHYVEGAALLR